MKRLFLLLFVSISFTAFSQVNIRDSVVSSTMVYGTYSFQFPAGDLSKLFGGNSTIGAGFLYKTRKNWLFGVEGNYLFGGTVKNQDSILSKISTREGFVIDANGYYADILFSERGFTLLGTFGKLIPVLSPNPNSGIAILVGAGYLQDKIRIHSPQNTTPQIYGDYEKGYDRLNSGVIATASIGYLLMSNSRLLNMYLGIEFVQSWNKFLRDRNFDTGMKDNTQLSSQFYGFKFKWFIPFYKRVPKEYYLY